MLLDPPDPVDLLIAHTHADQAVNLGARRETTGEERCGLECATGGHGVIWVQVFWEGQIPYEQRHKPL